MRPLLVFLPGTLCTDALFAPQVAALADLADTQVEMLTGGETIAACAAEILQRLPEHFLLAGFSQGGLVALEMVRRAPERVRKLCLISTNPRASTPQNLETWTRWQQQARSGAFTDIVHLYAKNVYGAQSSPATRKIVEMAFSVGVETFLTQLEMLKSRIDSRPTLGRIACPTLLIGGCEDRLTPPELQEEMCALIPHAELAVLGACGHYAPLEQPNTVSKLMRTWLKSSDKAGSNA